MNAKEAHKLSNTVNSEAEKLRVAVDEEIVYRTFIGAYSAIVPTKKISGGAVQKVAEEVRGRGFAVTSWPDKIEIEWR